MLDLPVWVFPVFCCGACGAEGGVAVGVVMKLEGSAKLLKRPVKLGMLAMELKMLSSLTASVLAAGTGVAVEVLLGVALAGLATSLAAPARLGM